MTRDRRRFALLLTVLTAAFVLPARAEFAPITPAELALAQVPGAPTASAVVLFRKAEFHLLDLDSRDLSSRLIVRERVKILTDKGKERGEIEIRHSDFHRLYSLAARTVLPDGRVVPVPKDAKFERRRSKNEKSYSTSIAFPEVAVGAILDAEYELRFDSLFYLRPFYFSDEIPVLSAEILYFIPPSVAVKTWLRDPFAVGVQFERGRDRQSRTLRAWATRLPPVPDEPYQVPFEDLATQMMLLPLVYDEGMVKRRLLEGWDSTSLLLEKRWDEALRHDGDAGRKASSLAGALADRRAKAEAIYRFVRDEIATDEDGPKAGNGIFLADEQPSVDAILRDGHGGTAEKSALLIAMLRAAKLDAKPVWAAPRSGGVIGLDAASPAWFDRVLVAVDLGSEAGGRIFLDPCDRRLGFGRLLADYEGTAAVIPDDKKPELFVLPAALAESNAENARIDLAIDERGIVHGTGSLALKGHSAVGRLRWRESPEKTAEAWKDELGRRFGDSVISEVKVAESVEAQTVEVSWAMAQRAEEALGDEVTLTPSRPVGPATQPFTQPGSARRAPILFDFPYREEVELRVSWPAGWAIESAPAPARATGPAGTYATEIERHEAERNLVVKRRFDLGQNLFATPEACEQARTLFGAAAKGDAQRVVLVKR